MGHRLLYRLLLVLPVTLSILLVSLFLFYQLPGLHVLDTREFQLGSERELLLNLRQQQQQNPFSEARGLFYVGISPGYLPPNFDRIPLMFRSSFKSLSREVDNPYVMQEYGHWVVNQMEMVSSGFEQSPVSIRQFMGILRARNKEELRSALASVEEYSQPGVHREVLDALPDGNTPLIKFNWNGNHNIFHRYLNAIIQGDPVLYTQSGELVRDKFGRSMWWTLGYTLPALVVGWLVVFGLVLGFYDRSSWMNFIDRSALFWYSIPTFVLATLALVFFTSHRYGALSRTFPFPVFIEMEAKGLWNIYRYYGAHLVLPMVLFALSPMLLLFRIFYEKIREIRSVQPSFRYLQHLGLSARDFRLRYLSMYLGVAGLAVFSNMVVSMLGGSLIIEWIFNIPGLGRFFYTSVVNYDVPSTIFLIVIFTIVQQLGHILADGLIGYFYPAPHHRTGVI